MEERREFETWALTRAHQIMSQEGYKLVVSAQNLDRKSVKDNSYNLLRAIADSLLEARGQASA